MSLVLNIYTDEDSILTREELVARVAQLPHFKTLDSGELEYNNEDTGVYAIVGNEPVERPVKGFRSLELAFIVNYMRPEFFGLEIFSVIESVTTKYNLFIDNEQAGVPARFMAKSMHAEWLAVNDNGIKQVLLQHQDAVDELARDSRSRANKRWEFLFHLRDLENMLGDVYVAQPFYLRAPDGQLKTMVTWPDAIIIALPPATDYVAIITSQKKLFGSKVVTKGLVRVDRLLMEMPDAFVATNYGGKLLREAQVEDVQTKLQTISYDLEGDALPGVPISSDRVVDVDVT